MNKLCYVMMVAAVVVGAELPAYGQKGKRLDENGLPVDLKAPSKDRVTRDELNSKRKESAVKFQIVPNKSVPMNPSIYDNSTIITYDGKHTILPKDAVMFVPDKLKDRVVEKPVGKFILWPEFLRQNFGWLSVVEVNVEQATGREHLKLPMLEAIAADQRISVSVYQRHPISYKGNIKRQLEAAKQKDQDD